MEIRFIFTDQEEFDPPFWHERINDIVAFADKMKFPPVTVVTFVRAEPETLLLPKVI